MAENINAINGMKDKFEDIFQDIEQKQWDIKSERKDK